MSGAFSGARPPVAELQDVFELELRGDGGGVRGLYDVYRLRGMIYRGELGPDAKVRLPAPGSAWPGDPRKAGAWHWISQVDALREVLELMGKDPEPPTSEHRIAGWQASAEEDADTGPSATTASQVLTTELRTSRRSATRVNLKHVLIGTTLLVLVLVVVGLVLIS